jgi:hypothetical protein
MSKEKEKNLNFKGLFLRSIIVENRIRLIIYFTSQVFALQIERKVKTPKLKKSLLFFVALFF